MKKYQLWLVLASYSAFSQILQGLIKASHALCKTPQALCRDPPGILQDSPNHSLRKSAENPHSFWLRLPQHYANIPIQCAEISQADCNTSPRTPQGSRPKNAPRIWCKLLKHVAKLPMHLAAIPQATCKTSPRTSQGNCPRMSPRLDEILPNILQVSPWTPQGKPKNAPRLWCALPKY